MAKSTPMHVLRNLAEQNLNDITQQLGKVRQAHASAAAHLAQLSRYEQEYGRQMQSTRYAGGDAVKPSVLYRFAKLGDSAADGPRSGLPAVGRPHAGGVEKR